MHVVYHIALNDVMVLKGKDKAKSFDSINLYTNSKYK